MNKEFHRLNNPIQFNRTELIMAVTDILDNCDHSKVAELVRVMGVEEAHPIMSSNGLYEYRGFTTKPEFCPFKKHRSGSAEQYLQKCRNLIQSSKDSKEKQ